MYCQIYDLLFHFFCLDCSKWSVFFCVFLEKSCLSSLFLEKNTVLNLQWQVRIHLLSLSELCEKSRPKIILCNFESKPQSNSYIFRKMFIIGQNLKPVHVTYSTHEVLIKSSRFFLSFISHCIKEILYVTTYHKLWRRRILKNTVFFNA